MNVNSCNKKKITPILIGGYMHTGTTLLFTLLKSINTLYYGQKEPKILNYFQNFKFKSRSNIEKKITGNNEYFSKEKNSAIINKDNFYQQYLESYDYLANEKNMKFWLDGTLGNYMYFEKLYELNKNIHLIIVQRDPIDILGSVKKRFLTTNKSRYKDEKVLSKKKLEKTFSLFLNMLSLHKTFKIQNRLIKLFPNNVILIDYKDLVINQKHTMERIFEFLSYHEEYKYRKIDFINSSDINKKANESYQLSTNYDVFTDFEKKFIYNYFFKIYNFKNSLDYNINYFKYLFLSFIIYLKSIIELPYILYNRFRLLNNQGKFYDYLILRIKKIISN